jgi:flagellar assembly factor FliW
MSRLTLVGTEPDEIVVHSDVLGALTVRASDMLLFPHGLLGFPECRRFTLIRGSHDALFWLQSLDYPALVFLLVDPFAVVDGYSIDMPASQLDELGPSDASDIALLAVVTLPAKPGDSPTANLQGPLAINFGTRRAKQVVLSDAEHGARCPVDLMRLVA